MSARKKPANVVRAYWFFGATLRDGRPIPADGEWLEEPGRIVICEKGLHASEHPFDALQYAPGPNLALVELSGTIKRQSDKLCAKRRRIVARFDATDLLRAHARQSALSVIHLWDAPAVVREYLETGDESKRDAAWVAARDAAWAAARAAARDDARAAARDDARAAARDDARAAARDAALAAAWDAAWAAAWDAAWAAAWVAARDAAWAAARDDARAAARDAAWAAARDAAKQRFADDVAAKFRSMGVEP